MANLPKNFQITDISRSLTNHIPDTIFTRYPAERLPKNQVNLLTIAFEFIVISVILDDNKHTLANIREKHYVQIRENLIYLFHLNNFQIYKDIRLHLLFIIQL